MSNHKADSQDTTNPTALDNQVATLSDFHKDCDKILSKGKLPCDCGLEAELQQAITEARIDEVSRLDQDAGHDEWLYGYAATRRYQLENELKEQRNRSKQLLAPPTNIKEEK